MDDVFGSSGCVLGGVLQTQWVGLSEWAQVLEQPQTIQRSQVTGEVHGRVCSVVIRAGRRKHHV